MVFAIELAVFGACFEFFISISYAVVKLSTLVFICRNLYFSYCFCSLFRMLLDCVFRVQVLFIHASSLGDILR